jgi:hypothetical protein
MQHIRFGLSIDSGAGMHFHAAVGRSTLGPLGLLNVLETHLGLLRAPVSQSERVVQMRQCLRAAMTAPRFYARSFEADELGSAATLLGWRDLWFEHGWSGTLAAGAGASAGSRLADMVAVEALASSAVARGMGQRLADVANALQHRRPQIERIELLDPLADFPLAWRRALQHLPVVDASWVEPAGRSGTMLRDLQDALCQARDGERASRLAWRGDGTLRVVRAETGLGAAQWQAMQMRQGRPSHVVVAPSGGSLLDAALAAADRPRLGLAGASTLRPALQLVPLAMQLLWAPLDFSALLQFLTHPLHPIHPMARRRIAERLADAPGIGGKGWQELFDEIAAELGDRGTRVMADVAFWIEHERFDPAERAPLSAALERAERLATFFSNRLLDEDLARRSAWHAGHAQASALCLALQALMAQGDDRIGPEMLNKLVAQASGRGSGNPLLDAQAGALPSVTDPAAVVEPFDEVTWWQLAAGSIPAPYVWSRSEIESLRAAGVELPEIPSLLERQARGALRPLLLARERLTLVLPTPGQEVHPVWLLVEGLLDKNLPIETVESALAAGPAGGITPVRHETLPALRRWWQLPGGTVVPWPAKVSYSSLQPLLFNPYQWLLRYPARLQASALLNMPNDFRLLGQLAHRAVERLYGHAGSLGWTKEQVAHWFDQNLDAIVDEEGAVLRMPGKRSELEGFRLRFRASLLRLHAHLQTAKVERVESEKEFEAETALGLLHGSTDLLLSFGGSREAVIDMKWAGTSKYRKVLEQGSHLQLAVYAFLQERASKRWPAVGYYILREGDLLTPAENLFPDARLVSQAEGATAALWEQAKATWRWRRAQIDKGAVELVVDGTEATDESAPPPDAMVIEPLDARYNPYAHLAGWESGR